MRFGEHIPNPAEQPGLGKQGLQKRHFRTFNIDLQNTNVFVDFTQEAQEIDLTHLICF